jgi:hypothetical protein
MLDRAVEKTDGVARLLRLLCAREYRGDYEKT